MKLAGPPRVLLALATALLAATGAVAVPPAAGRCGAPYKTLSSDCRGGAYDASTLCLVLDQSGGGDAPSPCKTAVPNSNRSECAVYTGAACDVLSYRVAYSPGQARFHVKFAGQRRALVAGETVAPPPPTLSARRLAGDGSGGGSVDPPVVTPVVSLPTLPPPRPPRTHVPVPTFVDFPPEPEPPTPSPPVTVPPTPSDPQPTRVPNLPTRTPTPLNPPGTLVPDLPTRTPTPSDPQPTRVPDLPTPVAGGGSSWPPPTQTPTKPPQNMPGPVSGNTGDWASLPSESNQFVQAIGALEFDPSLTQLRLIGGSSEFGTRGTVAELRLDSRFLVKSPKVTSLWIINCNVGDQFATDNILSEMPKGLVDLNLRNTLMKDEPDDLSVLQTLRNLELQQNYLATLSKNVALPKLVSLDLSENVLTSVEAFLPALESLYLKKNKLNAIPDVVYSMNKLTELQIAGNPIYAIVMSESQHTFIKKIHVTIDKPPVVPPQPVVYVDRPANGDLPTDVTNLILSSKLTDFSGSSGIAAVPVGSQVDLEGFPVWRLPDAIYEVFRSQQELLGRSDVTIGGSKAPTYLASVATSSDQDASVATSSDQDATVGSNQNIEGAAAADGSKGGKATSGLAGSSKTIPGSVNGTSDAPTTDASSASTKGGNSTKTVVVTLAVAAVVAALFAMMLFARSRRRNSNASKATDESLELTTPREGSSMASYQVLPASKRSDGEGLNYFGALVVADDDARVRDLFSSRRVRVGDLEDVQLIGSGTASVIWLVRLRGSRNLASKRLIQSSSTSLRMSKFVNEVVIAADLDHPSVVRLMGVAWTNETDLQALYEFMPNGDLETYLRNTSPTSFTWSTTKLQMAIDIVEALVYTHSFNPPLLHRDLRTRNVLLDSEHKPKLSNFGSARFASEQNTMTTDGVGSARWLSPEVLSGRTDYDQTSDMYAFGVLLCELDTHAAPYADARGQTETAVMELVVRGELRPSLSASCPAEIRSITSRCVAQDPASRPSAMQVAYELRLLLRDQQQQSSSEMSWGEETTKP